MDGFRPMGMHTPDEDLEALRLLAREAARAFDPEPPVFVEVGSWAGRTALVLADAVPSATVYCVDTWQGTPSDVTGVLARRYGPEAVYSAFCRNLGGHLLRRVFPLRGTSAFWAEHFPFRADLVFLDADHQEEAVRRDLAAWAPVVRDGGVLCGHDYRVFPGVTRAVADLAPFETVGRCVWAKRMGRRPWLPAAPRAGGVMAGGAEVDRRCEPAERAARPVSDPDAPR